MGDSNLPLRVRRVPPRGWRRSFATGVALFVVGSSCQVRNPASQAELLQTVNEIGDAVNALRQDTAVMQDQIDSLRLVVARQDSAIARLSVATGVPR